MYHQLGSFKHQKFIVSQLWRLEVWNQGIIRAVLPLITCRGESFLASLLLVFARDPWPPLVSRCITPVAASAVTGCSSCVCVFIWCSFSVCTSLLIRTPITGLRAHPSSVQSHLNWFHLQGPYFQGRCYSEVPQVGKSEEGSWISSANLAAWENSEGERTASLRRPKTLFDGKGDRLGVCSQRNLVAHFKISRSKMWSEQLYFHSSQKWVEVQGLGDQLLVAVWMLLKRLIPEAGWKGRSCL